MLQARWHLNPPTPQELRHSLLHLPLPFRALSRQQPPVPCHVQQHAPALIIELNENHFLTFFFLYFKRFGSNFPSSA